MKKTTAAKARCDPPCDRGSRRGVAGARGRGRLDRRSTFAEVLDDLHDHRDRITAILTEHEVELADLMRDFGDGQGRTSRRGHLVLRAGP